MRATTIRPKNDDSSNMLGAAVATTLSFVAAVLILERIDIVLYPDVFPGRTYVDEDGHRYTYEKRQSVGGYSSIRAQS